MRSVVALLTVLLMSLPSAAHACSCEWWTPNAIRSNAALVAEVEVLETTEAGTNSVAKLKTLTVFKGHLGAESEVRYSAGIGPSCEIDLKAGETLVIFGPAPPKLMLTMCSVIRKHWPDYAERVREIQSWVR